MDELTEQLIADPRLRWSGVAALAIVWLAIAWDDALILLLLGAPGAIVWLARKYPPRDEPELNDLL